MPNNKLSPSPAVLVACASGTGIKELAIEVCNGLEEEQIPYRLRIHEAGEKVEGFDGIAKVAYQAACRSNLNVGIFINNDGSIALHHEKLPELAPYFYVKSKELNKEKARKLGANAGRLVKRQPLFILDP